LREFVLTDVEKPRRYLAGNLKIPVFLKRKQRNRSFTYSRASRKFRKFTKFSIFSAVSSAPLQRRKVALQVAIGMF